MNKKTTIEWENVKVEKSIVNRLRSHKENTGVSIMAFTRMAILEKLARSTSAPKERISTKIKKSAK